MRGLEFANTLRHLSKAMIFSMIMLAVLPALAVNSGVTYQGRILKPDGSPLEGSNVQFRLQIRTPGAENCLLYEEQQSLDMRDTKGMFSLTLNDGSGARLDSSGFAIDRLFANRGTLNFAGGLCAIGSSYTPNEADGRKLIVQFKDETMGSWEPMPATNINFVPLALESKQVQGFGSQSLVRVQEADGTMGNISPLSNAAYSELLSLISGTSTRYVRNGTSAGARVPTYSGNPSSPVAGSIWFDTASNQLRYRDSSGVQTVGTASGSVTSVTAGSGLATSPAGGITSTGSIEIAVGGVLSTMLADGSVITAKIADGSVTDVKLANGAVITAKIADGAVTTVKLADDSVTSAKIDDGTIVGGDLASNIVITTTGGITAGGFTTTGTVAANTVTATGVTATTVSSGVSITRQIQLFDPDSGSTNKITFNADSALASDYTLTWPLNDGAPNQLLTTDGSGNLTWTTIIPGTGDFKADGTVPMTGNLRLGSQWLSNDGGSEGIRIDNSGNVGVGTATPQELLDVAGAIRVGTTTTCGAPNPGTIRYNSGNLEYCNGTAWQILGVAGAGISALTGDVTASGSGSVVATIANDAITNVKMADNAIGNAELADNAVNTAEINDGAVTSAKIADGTIATADVADKAVTFAKVQDIATDRLVGRSSALSGPMEQISIGTGLALSSGTLSSTVTGLPGCADGELALYVGSAWTCVGATSANTASTVMRRDSSGNFVSGTATLTSSLVLKDGAAGGGVTIATPVGFTSYALTLPSDDGNNGQVLTTDGTGALSWSSPATGDFKADGSVAMTGNLQLNNNWLSNDGGAEGIRVDNAGKVGVGTATPQELLDIAGAIRVGTTTTCGAPNPGTIRYNSGNLEYCNGTAWQILGVAGAGITALTGDVTASGSGSVAATIANDAITNAKLADNAVNTAEITDSAVTSAKISDGTVATADLADSSVTSAKIVDATIDTADVADSAITSAKIADGTIATADVADKAVTFAKTQDIATNKLVGRSTASSGPMEEISIGTGLSLSGGTLSTSVTGLPSCSDGELAIYVTSSWTCVGASSSNTASTVVRRDASGNFIAGSATLTTSLVLKDGAAGGGVTIATPTGFTSYALTLPSDDGNNGQVLTTDGSGALSWSTPAVGTGDFKADGTVPMTGNLQLNNNWLSNDGGAEGIRVDNSGNVGVGIAVPTAKLSVAGTADVSQTLRVGSAAYASDAALYAYASTGYGIPVVVGGDNGAFVQYKDTSGTLKDWSTGILDNSSAYTIIENRGLGVSAGTERFRIVAGGNVGIGTTDPKEVLDVAGAIRVGTTTTCGAPNPGTIRYNSGNLEYCNGTAWQVLGVAGAGITALTGDVTASGSGSVAATIAADAVTSAKIADGTIATADVADGAITSLKIADGTIATADVADKAVTFAKVQDIATNKLIGRSTASSGPIEEISIGTGLSLSGGTLSSSVTGLPGCADGELAIYITSAWTCVGATSANTASTVVRRDSSGNFVSGSATLTSSLILKDGAAGGQVSIATPVGFTNYALTLPVDDGNSGQVLTTNGSGALSWSTPATGTGDFKADGTVPMTGNLQLNNNWLSNDGGAEGIRVDNAGNVGIGTASPSSKLQVAGNIAIANTITSSSTSTVIENTGDTYGTVRLNLVNRNGANGAMFENTALDLVDFAFKTSTASQKNLRYEHRNTHVASTLNSSTGEFQFTQPPGAATDAWFFTGPNATIVQSGKLGVGTTSPQELLDVAGAIRVGTTTTCGAPNPGTIRYNSGNLEYCNGTAWQVLGLANSAITALTGDVTATGPGSVAATIAAGAVTNAKLGDNSVTSAKINDGTIVNADLGDNSVTSAKINDGTIVSADLADNAITTLKVTDKAVTFAKVQDIATNKLIGRSTALSGPMEELSVGTGLSLSGGTLSSTLTGLPSCSDGQLAIYVTSAWTCVGVGSTNVASTVVRRDGSGNFIAGSATLTSSLVLKDGAAGGQVSIATPVGFTSYALTLPVDDGTSGQVLATDGSGGLSWLSAGGDFKADGTVPMTGNLRLNDNWLSNDGGAEGIRVTNTGSVGIGTATPSELLHVSGGNFSVTGPGDAFATIVAPSGGGRSVLNFAGRGGGGTNSWMVHTGSADTNLYFKSGNNVNSSPNRVTFTGAGNVGIGTTTPATALEVAGDLTLSTGAERVITVGAPASGNGNGITIKAANGAASTNYGGGVTIQTGNGYWGRAGASLTMGASSFSGGNVTLIAGTPDNSGSPGTTTIQGGPSSGVAKAGAVYIKGGVGGGTTRDGGDVFAIGGVPGSSGNYGNVLLAWDGSAARGKVGIGMATPSEMLEVSGNVRATSFITTSDARLKEDIAQVPGLEAILKLKGVRWAWKTTHKPDMGVLAQDVERVFPDAVVTDPKTGFKAVKYQALIAPLIESTKELYGMCKANEEQNEAQNREIASLKSENEKLKGEVDELKKRMEQIEKLLSKQK